ncbi:MAG: rod shape-determining protein RodA [Armatimonadota bacterium]|nr:rod shape-determining protein RodA [Armatimonadota bacterium]MCX7777267.1 rod shape-determining protein RodA [Armatimonadota bacterium]MDW8024681.1 rod shape-determining protein RodA [Armatimonadota bacterium]
MSGRRQLRNFDLPMLMLVLSLIALGLLTLTSATYGAGLGYIKRQILFTVAGLAAMVGIAAINFQRLAKFSGWIYVLTVFLLLIVLIVGKEVAGAQRWIKLGPLSIQPSEFSKVACIITLSSMLSSCKEQILSLKFILRTAMHVSIPMLLVLLQPDLGTAIVIMGIWLGLLWLAGAAAKHIAAIVLVSITLFAVGWQTGFVKDYQKRRLIAFINPYADPLKSGYHIIQAQTAIGSGGFAGKGLFKGKMSKLKFVPARHTDFIFVTLAEELGFVGSILVIALYIALLNRMVFLMRSTEHELGVLLIGGVFFMLLIHIVVNIGMCLRLMPITGIPLPLLSYGGSHLLSTLMAIGICQSIAMRRSKLNF